MMFGSLSDTAMSSMRPPMLAGPIERNLNAPRSGSADWPNGASTNSGNSRRTRASRARIGRGEAFFIPQILLSWRVDATVVSFVGTGLAVAGALALTRFMQRLLFGVR